MKRILFVGHSNYVQASNGQARNKRSGKKTNPFHSPSDAASRKEIGKLDYPLAGRKLAEHGILCFSHTVSRMTTEDNSCGHYSSGIDSSISRVCWWGVW